MVRTCAECGRLVAPGEDHPHLLDDVPSPAAPSPTIAQPLSEEPRVTLMVRVEGDQILVTAVSYTHLTLPTSDLV